MIGIVCLWWVGLKLTAPTWYFVLLGIAAIINFSKLAAAFYKIGKAAAKNEE